jgi:hypothetical protein
MDQSAEMGALKYAEKPIQNRPISMNDSMHGLVQWLHIYAVTITMHHGTAY